MLLNGVYAYLAGGLIHKSEYMRGPEHDNGDVFVVVLNVFR